MLINKPEPPQLEPTRQALSFQEILAANPIQGSEPPAPGKRRENSPSGRDLARPPPSMASGMDLLLQPRTPVNTQDQAQQTGAYPVVPIPMYGSNQHTLPRQYDSDGQSISTSDMPPLDDHPTIDLASNEAVVGDNANLPDQLPPIHLSMDTIEEHASLISGLVGEIFNPAHHNDQTPAEVRADVEELVENLMNQHVREAPRVLQAVKTLATAQFLHVLRRAGAVAT